MDRANIPNRVRIAIAVAALCHKPPEQSISAYILDLKERFPIPNESASQENSWRTRALALEEENELLRLNAQKHQLEIAALKAMQKDAEESNIESSQVPKKKKKIIPSASKVILADRVDLRALVKDIRSGPRLPVLRDSLDILTSFRAVRFLNGRPMDDSERETILIPTFKRSLAALGKLLSAVIARDGSVITTSSRVDVAHCLSDLLLTLLNSTLPLVPPDMILPHTISELTLYIVRPVIQAFHTLSVREIALSVKENDKKAGYVDIRPDLMTILRQLIETLRVLKVRTRELREFMVLEAAKEVEALWRTVAPASGGRTQEQRIETLARKDSLWYHCAVLHAALDRLPSSRPGDVSTLSSEAVRVLTDLVRHFDFPAHEVAKGMVLGVLEKAWLSCLYESPPRENT